MEWVVTHIHAKRSNFRNPEPQRVSSLWGGLFRGDMAAGGEGSFLPPPKIQFGDMGQTLLQSPTQPSGVFW